jgi:hypothetical protein
VLGAAFAWIGVLLVILIDFEYGRDQGIYAVVARAILEGGAPYQDAWDFKPPMIFFVYAAARWLFGPEMAAVRILEALGHASLVWAFMIFSRRHVGSVRPGIIGGLVAVSAHVQLEFWHTGQPESFGAIATAWALVCATYTPAHGSTRAAGRAWLAWFTAAALYTFAALCKPPLGGGFLVSLGFILSARYFSRRQLRDLLPPVSAFLAGGLLVVGATWLFFVTRGAWQALESTLFVFVPEYTALSFDWGKLPRFFYRAVRASVVQYSAYVPVGLGLLLVLPRLSDREHRGFAHVVMVCVFQALGVALQGKFFGYHFSATLPLLGLLAGWGLWKLWLRVRTRTALAALTVAALLLLHDAHPGQLSRNGMTFLDRSLHRLRLTEDSGTKAVRNRLHTVAGINIGANKVAAEWIQRKTRDTETVFIWGFEPGIYDMADRRPASRYIYNVPQRLDWPGRAEARRELVQELRASMPAVFVVERNDAAVVVTGNKRDSATELNSYPELKGFLKRYYRREVGIERFQLNVLKPAVRKRRQQGS